MEGQAYIFWVKHMNSQWNLSQCAMCLVCQRYGQMAILEEIQMGYFQFQPIDFLYMAELL